MLIPGLADFPYTYDSLLAFHPNFGSQKIIEAERPVASVHVADRHLQVLSSGSSRVFGHAQAVTFRS